MTREGVIMYALRLPDGKWWRRGAGHSGGAPTTLKRATQYMSLGAAKAAATMLNLGDYDVVEVPRVIGEVVFCGRTSTK